MRVLIVEDDNEIASFVAKGLRQAGFAVDHVSNGKAGYESALYAPYDALVVDIMLPGMDGLDLIESLRNDGVDIPILVLTAKSGLEDKLKGFRAGTDDYVTKPFSFAELLVRLQALIRRAGRSQQQDQRTKLIIGDLELDLLARTVRRDGVEIELQPRELALLEYLMNNAGNVVTKTMILEHVWDYHFDPQTNVVDVLIHRLRNKVDRDFDVKLIQTVRGVGYVLKVPQA